jgi:hypothetical protein
VLGSKEAISLFMIQMRKHWDREYVASG